MVTREECESLGKIWVEGHYRYYGRGGLWVHAHCRHRTQEEKDILKRNIENFKKTKTNVSGHVEGKGSYPFEAVDEILHGMGLPPNVGIEFDLEDSYGKRISDENFGENGGWFGTTVCKDQKYYSIRGTVSKKNKKWVAGAEIEEVEVK